MKKDVSLVIAGHHDEEPLTDDLKTNGEKEEKGAPKVGFFKLFKYATWADVLMFIGGTIGALAVGGTMPAFSIIFGGLFEDFTDPTLDIRDVGRKYALLFGYLSIATFVLGFLQVSCFTIASERMVLRIRSLYLRSILKQDIEWFDGRGSLLSSQISEKSVQIKEGTGEKLGQLFQFTAMALAGFAVGFYFSWKLSLVILAAAPLLAAGGFIFMTLLQDASNHTAYEKAGAIAEEAFQSFRTVVAYGMEKRVMDRYDVELKEAERYGKKKARTTGIGLSFFIFVYFCLYGLVFYVGSVFVKQSKEAAVLKYPPSTGNPLCEVGVEIDLVTSFALGCFPNPDGTNFTFGSTIDVCQCAACQCGCAVAGDECLTGGDVVLVFFAVIIAAMSLGQMAPAASALITARTAAASVFEVINSEPVIGNDNGEVLTDAAGDIEFQDVTFRYPSRPEEFVFKGLNLTIESGKTTALVGGSGCGKSTIVALVQRFYDVEGGQVCLNGKDIRSLNVRSLRKYIGYVSQEPVLFACSIMENLRYGSVDRVLTDEEIMQACKSANCYEFIMALPDQFNTFVGERGGMLSGGQRQRIAIARALLRGEQGGPDILLLDEATSALDQESERVVQESLDILLKESTRTTIVIAHRLSTVRNADKIVVLGAGQNVLEEGNHATLKAKKGHYSALLAATKHQRARKAKKKQLIDTTIADNDDNDDDDTDFSSEEEVEEEESDSGQGGTKKRGSSRFKTFSMKRKGSTTTSNAESTSTGEEDGKKKGKKKLYKVPLKRIFTEYSYQEKWLYIPAIVGSMINGVQMPIFAILFAEISNVFFLPTSEQIEQEASKYALYFTLFSFLAGASQFCQMYIFGYIGEKMTTRVRHALLSAYLTQEVGFFDLRDNSVGAVTGRLASDAALIKAALVDRMGISILNISTLIAGLTIAFVKGWEMALVLLGLLPLMIIGGAVQMLLFTSILKEDAAKMSEANQVLTESISGIRIVTAFQLREKISDLYNSYLAGPAQLGIRKGLIAGFGFALSQGLLFVTYSVSFWYGAQLIADKPDRYDFQVIMSVFFAIVMTGVGIGQASAMAGDVAKAGHAIDSVFKVIDRESEIDPTNPQGKKERDESDEDIKFDNVVFKYPTRDALVFNGVSLEIKGGTQVAFVGESGSGKSTLCSLVERFYDPMNGSIKFHGIETTEANIQYLREAMAFVEQEPRLFKDTIFNNIAAGVPDSEVVLEQELIERVEQAAMDANAHDFIMEFPNGYDTMVDQSSLSGGQKQRICIARALVRNPRVLLLDEATAALDNISEAVVKSSFEKRNCTILVVAHRLSTIKHCDKIVVFHQGHIVEQGTHAELLSKGNAYAKLYKAQNKSK